MPAGSNVETIATARAAVEAPPAPAPPSAAGPAGAAQLILFAAGSLLVTGYRVYGLNHGLQITLVRWLEDPGLFPGDPFVATLAHYASLFWYAIAAATHLISLEPLLRALFVIERALGIFAAAMLSQRLVPGSRLAPVAAMALVTLTIEPIVGHGTIIADNVEQTGFFMPFFLLAVAAFLDRRPIAWAFATAVAFDLNSLYGIFALSYFGVAFVVDEQYRREWRRWTAAGGVLLAVVLPALWLSALDFARGAGDDKLWLEASHARVPHHLYPLSWDRRDLALFILLMTAVGGAFRAWKERDPRLARLVHVWSATALAWLGFAFLAAAAASPAMLVLQPGRATDLWVTFASIALTSCLAGRVEESRAPRIRMAWLVALLASLVVWHPAEKLAVLWAMPLGLGLWSLPGIVVAWRRPGAISGYLLAGILLIAAALFGQRWHHDGFWRALLRRPPREERVIAEWAARDTPRQARFLVDPSWDEFRAIAARGVFTTWKDGSAILWERPFVIAWAERLRLLGVNLREENLAYTDAIARLIKNYNGLTDDRVRRLAADDRLDYWVVRRRHRSTLPEVFAIRGFKVLALHAP